MKRPVLALFVFLAGCGADRSSGGNGTSTDNVLSARLRVDSILHELPPGDFGPYPLLVRMDSSMLTFPSSWADGRDFRVYLNDSVPLPHVVREWNVGIGRGSAWVRLPTYFGSSRRTITVHIGRDSTISRSNARATWAGVSDLVRANTSTILLAEFDEDSLTPMTQCGCNRWYASRSPGASLGSNTGIEAAGRGRAGRAFHLSYSTPLSEWALVGTTLGSGPNRFAGLDSLVFWARGNGKLQVALETFRDSADRAKAWKTVSLDTSWQRFSVAPSTFDPEDTWSIGWNKVRDRVTTLTFFGRAGSDFWIDGIRLYGISPAEVP